MPDDEIKTTDTVETIFIVFSVIIKVDEKLANTANISISQLHFHPSLMFCAVYLTGYFKNIMHTSIHAHIVDAVFPKSIRVPRMNVRSVCSDPKDFIRNWRQLFIWDHTKPFFSFFFCCPVLIL